MAEHEPKEDRYFMEPGVVVYDTKFKEFAFCLFDDDTFVGAECYFVTKRAFDLDQEECALDIEHSILVCGKELEELTY